MTTVDGEMTTIVDVMTVAMTAAMTVATIVVMTVVIVTTGMTGRRGPR